MIMGDKLPCRVHKFSIFVNFILMVIMVDRTMCSYEQQALLINVVSNKAMRISPKSKFDAKSRVAHYEIIKKEVHVYDIEEREQK